MKCNWSAMSIFTPIFPLFEQHNDSDVHHYNDLIGRLFSAVNMKELKQSCCSCSKCRSVYLFQHLTKILCSLLDDLISNKWQPMTACLFSHVLPFGTRHLSCWKPDVTRQGWIWLWKETLTVNRKLDMQQSMPCFIVCFQWDHHLQNEHHHVLKPALATIDLSLSSTRNIS